MPGINVIVPLGGVGNRFQKEGYVTRPKPFVQVLGKPLLMWVLENLHLEADDTLVIVFNPEFMNLGLFMRQFVLEAFPTCKLVELAGPTRGAAETVLLGLRALSETQRERPTLLADGDTFYTVDVVAKFKAVAETHNAVFCFSDTQPNPIYSYVKLGDEDDVLEVKEKVKISDWANSGCYCFRSGDRLATECEALMESNSLQAGQDGSQELYTSGVIAAMVAKKEPFRGLKVEAGEMHVLGTPSQVEGFCKTWPTQPRSRFVFDLEGVLAIINDGTAEPIMRNIKVCQRLKRQGHTIIVQSTRPWGMEKKIWAMLEQLNVPADQLALGKPWGDHYISGPGTVDSLLGNLDKQVGFYPTDVKATWITKGCPTRPPKTKKAPLVKIGTLNPASVNVNLRVKVLDHFKELSFTTKEGYHHRFWEVTCGDESGKIVLSMREAQTTYVTRGCTLLVKDANIKMSKGGFMRLIVDKWGKVELDESGEGFESIGRTNLSLIEYELVDCS